MAASNITDEILRLIKAENYRINETILDALDEFLALVEEENEGIDEHFEDQEDLEEEEEE